MLDIRTDAGGSHSKSSSARSFFCSKKAIRSKLETDKNSSMHIGRCHKPALTCLVKNIFQSPLKLGATVQRPSSLATAFDDRQTAS